MDCSSVETSVLYVVTMEYVLCVFNDSAKLKFAATCFAAHRFVAHLQKPAQSQKEVRHSQAYRSPGHC